ncbi:MAG: hypothetical protein EBR49_08940 [Betaproteobacteria bacterium]|nr:hypothetical protein [Betaproteobacteria bacterium]
MSKCSPHAPPLRGSLPPKGAHLPWGGPAANSAVAGFGARNAPGAGREFCSMSPGLRPPP